MEKNNRTLLIVLTAAVIVVAVFASFGLPLFAGPTPTITLPTPAPTGESPVETGNQTTGERVEVTPDTVQSVIAALSRLESYTRVVTTTMEGTESVSWVNVDGGWTRSDMRTGAGAAVRTIVGDGRVWRWYDGSSSVASWPADSLSADLDTQRVPTYEDVLALDKSSITAAGYEEKDGQACVYVEVTVPRLSQVERYWVSADSGLLIAAENETGGEIVWSMTAGEPEVPVSSAVSFSLPDGTVLHTVGGE